MSLIVTILKTYLSILSPCSLIKIIKTTINGITYPNSSFQSPHTMHRLHTHILGTFITDCTYGNWFRLLPVRNQLYYHKLCSDRDISCCNMWTEYHHNLIWNGILKDDMDGEEIEIFRLSKICTVKLGCKFIKQENTKKWNSLLCEWTIIHSF